MVFFSKKNGIYSSRMTLHVYSIALQAMIGVKMLLASPNKTDFSLVFGVRSVQDVYKLGFDLLQYGGVAHILLSLVTLVGVVCTYFVTSMFKLPMIVITMIQGSYCSTTAMVCVYLLQRGYSSVNKLVDYLAKTGSYLGFNLKNTSLLIDKREDLFVIGLLAIMASSMYSRAQLIKGNDSAPSAMVMAPSLTIGLAIAFALIAPCRDYRVVVLGGIWLLICVAGEVITTVTSCRCFEFLDITMIFVYGSMFVFSLVTIIHCVKIYTNGRLDYSSYVALLKGRVDDYVGTYVDDYVHQNVERYVNYDLIRGYFQSLTTSHTNEQINLYMGNGDFLVVVIMLATVNTFFSFIATLYTLFHFFDFNSHETPREVDDRKFCVVIDQKK